MIVEAILLGIGLSMDAFAVSVTNGMLTKRMKVRYAFLDGLTFGLFQAVMPLIGLFLGMSFMKSISAVDHWIGFVLLAAIGGNMIREALRKEDAAATVPHPYSVHTLLMQGIATSIDALAVGIGFSTQMNSYREAYLTVAIIGVSTFLISGAGVYIGKLFGGVLKEKAQIFGGVILIGLGIKILVEHLFF